MPLPYWGMTSADLLIAVDFLLIGALPEWKN